MKTFRKIIFAVLIVVVLSCLGGYIWLRSTTLTYDFTVQATCQVLNDSNVELPAHIEVSRLGHAHLTVDLSYLTTHYEAIMRRRLPPEGGGGGDRYSYRSFAITALPNGTAKASVHIKLDNYKYTNNPLSGLGIGGKKLVSIKAGTVEADAIVIITPTMDTGSLQTTSSVTLNNTRESGLVRIFNDLLPRIWFSVSRKLHTRQNETNRATAAEKPILEPKDNPAMDAFLDEVFTKNLLTTNFAHFVNGSKGLSLDADFRINGGFLNYYKLAEIYRRTNLKLQ